MNRRITSDMESGGTRVAVMVAGVGSGGAAAVGRIHGGWPEGPACIAIDTDAVVLGASGVEHRIEIGASMAKGQGAGGDPKLGVTAAEDDFSGLRGLMESIDMLFLVTALGGGTGTGAAPVVARAAQEAGALVVCFATLPFSFEGDTRRRTALRGLRDLNLHADVVIVLPNDRLLEAAVETEPIAASFAASDAILGVAVRSIWRLLSLPGILNLNLADVRTLIEHSGGTCSLGHGSGHGASRAEQALDDLVHNSLMERGAQLAKSNALLVGIVGGENMTLREIQSITEGIRGLAPQHAHVLVGAGIDAAMPESIAVTVLSAEEWIERPRRDEAPAANEDESAASDAPTPESRKRGRSKEVARRRALQKQLSAESGARDRFRGVEPTLYRGEDLDIPTFIRKRVRLSEDPSA